MYEKILTPHQKINSKDQCVKILEENKTEVFMAVSYAKISYRWHKMYESHNRGIENRTSLKYKSSPL